MYSSDPQIIINYHAHGKRAKTAASIALDSVKGKGSFSLKAIGG